MGEARFAPTSTTGLLVDNQPIPLQGVKIDATLTDVCTRVTIIQHYRNLESHPVEAVYVFPLDETAAVCGFEAIIDDVHVVGKVTERDEAFATYDDALAAGHGAYLLDQERPDVFTASIGNIPPGKRVLIKITYVTELGFEGDALRFVLPTTVSPRYAPAEDRTGLGRPPAEAVNPPVAWRVPYGLELTVQLDMPSDISGLESPSHALATELHGTRATVRLEGRETALDRDFVLFIRLAEPYTPRARVETNAQGWTAMVAFRPTFDVAQAPCEVIFVIDRSGSMRGTSIAEARNALQLCLRSLTEGTYFNVVGFGSTYEMLFPESRPYTDATLDEATRHVQHMTADLGGTEILAPLRAVFETEPHPALPRQVFVLTDGQVTNTEAVIALVRRHVDTARVFTFGIGAGASHHLVRGMARAGEGAAEFIAPGERIEAKVLRQLDKALAPGLTEVRIDWGRLRVQQAPYRVPPVFAGGRVLVYGFVENPPQEEQVEVMLSAKGPRGPLSCTVPVDFRQSHQDNVIATLGARLMLRDLEEGASAMHDRKGSLQSRIGTDRVKAEAVRLGVTYGLCSRWTSFVAVEQRQTPVAGSAELRKIPVALTRGWGGLDAEPLMAALGAFGQPASGRRLVSQALATSMDSSAVPEAVREVSMELRHATPATPLRGHEAEAVARFRQAERPLDRLIRLQRADGSWELSESLARILGKRLADLEARLTAMGGQDAESRRAWATALALYWLQAEAAAWPAEWKLLAQKARRWLDRCPARLAGGVAWLDAAAMIMQTSP
jgi:hypothetical protein